MKSYNKPKGEAHWGDPKGKAKGKGEDPKGKESKGKGDPAGKGPGPYSNAAGDGPAGQQEPPYQVQTEHDNRSLRMVRKEALYTTFEEHFQYSLLDMHPDSSEVPEVLQD